MNGLLTQLISSPLRGIGTSYLRLLFFPQHCYKLPVYYLLVVFLWCFNKMWIFCWTKKKKQLPKTVWAWKKEKNVGHKSFLVLKCVTTWLCGLSAVSCWLSLFVVDLQFNSISNFFPFFPCSLFLLMFFIDFICVTWQNSIPIQRNQWKFQMQDNLWANQKTKTAEQSILLYW